MSEVPREAGLAPDDPSFDISSDREMRALMRAEDGHFWHRARNRFILEKLEERSVLPPARVLELGCGGGAVSAALASAGYQVTGVDGHRSLIALAETRAPHARFFCRDLRRGVPDLADESFDVVGLFDVLEHLEDPAGALDAALTFARSGGLLVGTVPALMSLWSPVDEHAGHKVRYDQRSLERLLLGAESVVEIEVAPFFRSLVPLMWAQRRFIGRRGASGVSEANLSIPRWPLNDALLALLRAEHAVLGRRGVRALPGASLWFSLRKA